VNTSDEGEVSTHVLIPSSIADQLKELSRRSRITQSEFLREAVTDLLAKYERGGGTIRGLDEKVSHE
jgi:Arc/MetJ-type ribon-helix-helix transcriptional regulator